MTMTAISDGLRRSRALVARGWTQGVAASAGVGRECDPRDPAAQWWCATGAVDAAALDPPTRDAMLEALAAQLPASPAPTTYVILHGRYTRAEQEACRRAATDPETGVVSFPTRLLVSAWADATGRRRSEVLALFDRAIASV